MADKKISELPLLNSVSGSSIIVPLVHDGTTNKLNLSQIAHYTSQWSAKTGSANTFTGNQTIVGNLVVSGDLTAERYYIETISSSVIYESGSTVFGNSGDDTHTFTGSIILNGATIGAAELNSFTASQLAVNLGISSVTGSINTTTSSFDSVFLGISSTTGSINTTTSSFDSVFLGISSTTGSMNVQSASQDLVNRGISSVTGSINTTTSSFDSVFLRISSTTGSINTTTSSFDSEFNKIGSTTASIHFTTGALNAFTGSVIGQTNTISTFTSSVNFTTQSLNTQTGSQDLVNLGISSVTGSINTTTSSFDLVFRGISSVTGAINLTTSSLIGITNGLMAFTAALDNTYATDAQLYQLYQATASIHSATASLNTQTGSQDLVNTGISSVTGSINTTTSSFNSVFLGISSVTGAINLTTASLIGITNGLMAFTAALDSTYATDAQLYQLYQATASIHFTTQSLNTQSGSQDLVNLGISTFTGSLRSEVNLIEAYTASLKAAAIVSSSTQISNYYKFAETASANTFYGTQTINGNLQLSSTSPLVYNAGNTNAMLFGFFDGGTIYGPYYQIFGSNYSNVSQRGSAEFVFDSRNGGYSGFNIAEFNGSTWLRKFRVSPIGAEVTGSFVVDGGITGSLMATNNVVSSSTQIQNYFLFAQTSSANTFYDGQTFKGNVIVHGGNSVRLYETTNTNYWDVYTYTDNTLRVNYKGAGNDEIILYNDGGINFAGNITGSSNLTTTKAAIGANVTPTIPLEVYGQQKWYTTPGDGSELRGFFNPGGAGDDSELTLYKADGTTAGIKLTPNGIDFSANANAAGMTSELLNDYEEGTWTPVIRGSGTAGTYELQTDYTTYTKIGRKVTVSGNIRLGTSVTGGGTGYLQITGLPFQKAANTAAIGTVLLNGVDYTGNYVVIAFTSISASSILYLSEIRDNDTPIDLPISAVSANDEIAFTITYFN